jgi:putative phosphoribosyl transferase
MTFTDRADAGRQLAEQLEHLRGGFVVVLGLPRGGVVVAAQVAAALDAPLDVIVVRKLGVPQQPELGMGAVGEDGARVLNSDVIAMAGVSDADLAAVQAGEEAEVGRRARLYRGRRSRVPLDGRVALVVDDGVATGSTARAACRIARAHGAAKVVLAVPVAPLGWEDRLGGDADELVAVSTPDPFYAIGQFYDNFVQTTDDEVAECLAGARPDDNAGGAPGGQPSAAEDAAGSATTSEVRVAAGPDRLPGRFTVPDDCVGVVIFAHGTGSGRSSPRNRHVASMLNRAGLATLLLDLLTPDEALSRDCVFDIGLLAGRLAQARQWVGDQDDVAGLPVGYFGASTGAAAALSAAADLTPDVAAVVSRGGRPDLAWPLLGSVRAPTLLIVGGRDDVVLGLNQQAREQLGCESELAVIPGATHLFEEPGALDAVAELAREWFVRYLGGTEPDATS